MTLDCSSDNDCSQGRYCSDVTKLCTPYNTQSIYCYRSSDCTQSGVFCKSPGFTLRTACAQCPGDYLKLSVHQCNCGSASNCAVCVPGESPQQCLACLPGHVLYNNQCHKECIDGEFSLQQCVCGGTLCKTSNLCQATSQTEKCVPDKYDCKHWVGCKECRTDGSEWCEECLQGYVAAPDGRCDKKPTCLNSIQQCNKCDTVNGVPDLSCAECNYGYTISGDGNQCSPLACTALNANCATCMNDALLRYTQCDACAPGYTLINNQCFQTSRMCTTDIQCSNNQFCSELHLCLPFDITSEKCYRSSDCGFNKFCAYPGQTNKSECPRCSVSTIENARHCNCGAQLYCQTCSADNMRCQVCIEGYGLNAVGDCVKACTVEKLPGCACFGQTCTADQTCTSDNGCVDDSVTDSCQVGNHIISHCIQCYQEAVNDCYTCRDGYILAGNACVPITGCDVPHCAECPTVAMEDHGAQAAAPCTLCEAGYELISGECQEITCKQGTQMVLNCAECKQGTEKQFCAACEPQYVLINNKCVLSIDATSCTSDNECIVSQYCDLASRHCLGFSISEVACYRSGECGKNGTVCDLAGVRAKTDCPKCSDYIGTPMLRVRQCKCGSAKNCALCNQAGSGCSDCVAGYVLINSQCLSQCSLDATLQWNCACGGAFCGAGNLCTFQSGQYTCVSSTNNCISGSNKVEFCSTCKEGNFTRCAACQEAYELSEALNTCTAIQNCIYGDQKVTLCVLCDVNDVYQCKACKSGYEVSGNICIQQNCLSGSGKVEHCLNCASPDFNQVCIQCVEGYILADNKCILYDEEYACKNDFDCQPSSYCNISSKMCLPYDPSKLDVCYRSEQCEGNDRICLNPGSTLIVACDRCSAFNEPAIGNVKGCKCGEEQFCRQCDVSGVHCSACITGYTLMSGKCLANCAVGEVLDGECICDKVSCPTGYICKQVADELRCTDSSIPNCLTGSFEVQNCVACDPEQMTKCIECIPGYKTSEKGDSCEEVHNCMFGPSATQNCVRCSQTNELVCDECVQNYYLTDKKTCELETCLVGSSKVDNCAACGENQRLCDFCIPGYALNLNKCAMGCSNDGDCDEGQYCNTTKKECKIYKPSTSFCMRSSDCAFENSVCTVQGKTKIAVCDKCNSTSSDVTNALAYRGCKCMNVPYCAKCKEQDQEQNTWKCTECLKGYFLLDGKCQKKCTDKVNIEECLCGNASCAAGYACVDSKCTFTKDTCNEGPSFVNHCESCHTGKSNNAGSSLTEKDCAACYSNYDLVEGKCTVQNCQTKIINCDVCDATDDKKCIGCTSEFKLKNGNCSQKKGLTSTATLVVIAVVIVIVLMVGLLIGYFVLKLERIKEMSFSGMAELEREKKQPKKQKRKVPQQKQQQKKKQAPQKAQQKARQPPKPQAQKSKASAQKAKPKPQTAVNAKKQSPKVAHV